MATLMKRRLLGVPDTVLMTELETDKTKYYARNGLARAGAHLIGASNVLQAHIDGRGLTRAKAPQLHAKLDAIKKTVAKQHKTIADSILKDKVVNAVGYSDEDVPTLVDPEVLAKKANHVSQLLTRVGQNMIAAVSTIEQGEHRMVGDLNLDLDGILLVTTAMDTTTTMDIPHINEWGKVMKARMRRSQHGK
jgi:hypothetical protein